MNKLPFRTYRRYSHDIYRPVGVTYDLSADKRALTQTLELLEELDPEDVDKTMLPVVSLSTNALGSLPGRGRQRSLARFSVTQSKGLKDAQRSQIATGTMADHVQDTESTPANEELSNVQGALQCTKSSPMYEELTSMGGATQYTRSTPICDGEGRARTLIRHDSTQHIHRHNVTILSKGTAVLEQELLQHADLIEQSAAIPIDHDEGGKDTNKEDDNTTAAS